MRTDVLLRPLWASVPTMSFRPHGMCDERDRATYAWGYLVQGFEATANQAHRGDESIVLWHRDDQRARGSQVAFASACARKLVIMLAYVHVSL